MKGWSWRRVHRGGWVEVKSAGEILATLDAQGRLGGMHFMPEMLQFCGRRFQVASSAHKTCDTVHKTGIRSLDRAVHLEGLRCDGAGHGGCQAECLLFWRLEWLTPVSGPGAAPTGVGSPDIEILEKLIAWGRKPVEGETQPFYRCQATELHDFTHAAKWYDVRLYARDIWHGNVSIVRAVRVLGIAVFNMLQRLRGGVEYPNMYRKGWLDRTPVGNLGLQAGELVRVKPKAEILETLDKKLCNRGLSFDAEMTPFCGQEIEVHKRVERLIDERSGKMLTMPRDCIILKGVICGGDYSRNRRMCPRAIPSFWREVWLERVEQPAKS